MTIALLQKLFGFLQKSLPAPVSSTMMDLAMDPIASWQDLLLGDESQKTVLLGALTIIVVAISMEALGYSLSRMLSAILGRLRILTLRFLPKAGQEEGNPIVSQIFVYPGELLVKIKQVPMNNSACEFMVENPIPTFIVFLSFFCLLFHSKIFEGCFLGTG